MKTLTTRYGHITMINEDDYIELYFDTEEEAWFFIRWPDGNPMGPYGTEQEVNTVVQALVG